MAAEGVVLALPAYETAELVVELDPVLAEAHAEIPYASPAIVTLAFGADDVESPSTATATSCRRSRGRTSLPARGRRTSGTAVRLLVKR